MYGCSSPEVDMIYNKLENFPFPEKCPANICSIYTVIHKTPNPARESKCLTGFICICGVVLI